MVTQGCGFNSHIGYLKVDCLIFFVRVDIWFCGASISFEVQFLSSGVAYGAV